MRPPSQACSLGQGKDAEFLTVTKSVTFTSQNPRSRPPSLKKTPVSLKAFQTPVSLKAFQDSQLMEGLLSLPLDAQEIMPCYLGPYFSLACNLFLLLLLGKNKGSFCQGTRSEKEKAQVCTKNVSQLLSSGFASTRVGSHSPSVSKTASRPLLLPKSGPQPAGIGPLLPGPPCGLSPEDSGLPTYPHLVLPLPLFIVEHIRERGRVGGYLHSLSTQIKPQCQLRRYKNEVCIHGEGTTLLYPHPRPNPLLGGRGEGDSGKAKGRFSVYSRRVERHPGLDLFGWGGCCPQLLKRELEVPSSSTPKTCSWPAGVSPMD